MELESYRTAISSTVLSSCVHETKKQVKCYEEYSDIDEEYLNSVFEATRNVKMKPPICMYTIKTKELGFAAVDIKEFLDIAYATSYSSEIHVLSCNGAIVSEEEQKGKKWFSNTDAENFEFSQKFEEVNVLQHPTDVTAFSYTNGYLLVSCCLDGTVKAWDKNYQCIQSFSDPMKSLSDIHASPRLDYFVTSSLTGLKSAEGNTLYGASLFSFSRNSPVMSFLGHTAGTQCVRFHPNGMYIASASQDNTIKMWNTQTSKPVRTFQDESREYSHWRRIAFSPEGKYLASTYYGSVKIWDIASGRLLKTLGVANPNYAVHNICYSKFGDELVAGGVDGEIKVWNMKDFAVSSFGKSDVELLDCHILNQPILKIKSVNNIFTCVSVQTDESQQTNSETKKKHK